MPPQSEANSVATSNPLSENITNVDGGDVESAFSSAAAATPQKPVKKPTRQWAAWTRQEEENFFNALRQVGKNFEKITCRVQSKNKEQVRHYYYRLVRRMNKLLGPGFCLDAKNSKDTNAAMLRWWSLLEKYSCTASKLHLKPRRFKTFIETLAQQLLKDRNRTRRKRPYQGESGPIPMTVESMFNKPSGHDVHMVKLVFVDAQNSPKLGSTKLSSKRVNVSKGEGPVTKVTNQRRRAACGAAASAYKKWEKAAIAGVSLVADAAEHLERASIDKNGSNVDVTSEILPADGCITDAAGSIDCAQPPESSTPEEPQCKQSIDEINSQPPTKLKLQLFPIDEPTRKALEKDDRNPHLELTLSARKRISSILEHLSRKWGDSSMASGELMLFPYSAQQDNLAYSPRWTLKDSSASAGDVYTTVGSPTVFRLRYGWFSSLEDQSAKKDPLNSTSAGTAAEDDRDGHKQRQVGGVTTTMSAGEWADSLTNISVGDLLSEASRAQDVRPNGSAWSGISLSCDSFDAAIAGFISGHQGSSLSPPLASILDAEETCDEFSFPRALSAGSSGMGFAKESTAVVEQFGERAGPSEYAQASNYKADPAKTNELMDFYWPDSLGPLDLDVPPARYQGQDLLFGDAGGSLGGLTRLIASSLDAFQNCSFFAPEKESHAVGGMQGAASDS